MVPFVARPLTPAGRRLIRRLAPKAAVLIAAASLPAAFPVHGTSVRSVLAAALALAILLVPLLALHLYALHVRMEVGVDGIAWTGVAGRTRRLEREHLVEAVGHSVALPGRSPAAPLAVELRTRSSRVVLPEWLWTDEVLEALLSALDLPVRSTDHRVPAPAGARWRARRRIA